MEIKIAREDKQDEILRRLGSQEVTARAVKSVQRGRIHIQFNNSGTATVTTSSIPDNKALLVFSSPGGNYGASGGYSNGEITIEYHYAGPPTGNARYGDVYWQLIEFY